MATGTDAIIPGMTYATEIEQLVQCGLPPMSAIQSATELAAEALGAAGTEVGIVEAGRWADLVLVDGDPIEEIGAVRRVAAVVKGGEVVARTADATECESADG